MERHFSLSAQAIIKQQVPEVHFPLTFKEEEYDGTQLL